MHSRSSTAEVKPTASRRQRIDSTGHVSSKVDHAGRSSTADQPQASCIAKLYQQGSARIRFPNMPAGPLHAVLLNTAGGLTGDDHMQWQAEAEAASRLTLSTAACEKVYRTHGPAACQNTQLSVEAGAHLAWLPQETILFNGSSLNRSLRVDIDPDASALIAESVVLGRQAMNETVESLHLHDRWRIYRDKRLLHAEDVRMDYGEGFNAQRHSLLHHNSAFSTVVLINSEPAERQQLRVQRIRELATDSNEKVVVAASCLPQRLIVRALAHNSFYLRKFLIPCIELLSDGSPIPPVWNV